MVNSTKLTRDVVLFKEKISHIIDLFILQNKSFFKYKENGYCVDFSLFDRKRYNEFHFSFNANLGDGRIQCPYIIFDCLIPKPGLGDFFIQHIVYNENYPIFLKDIKDITADLSPVIAGLNKNQYYFKNLFLKLKKMFNNQKDIFDFLDDIIWKLI